MKAQFASKKYPNLYKYPNSSKWVFRKYSKEKRACFSKSTGEDKDETKAYRIGLEEFTKWMGTRIHHTGRPLLVRDIAKAILASKETKRDNTYRSAHNQLVNHVLPAFGHLRPSQISVLKWNEYDSDERRKGKRTKLFNTRKALIEILNRAKEEGLIQVVPKLKNHDGPSKPPKYLEDKIVRRILKLCFPQTKLLFYIVWKQGARPSEVLQYEWGMIDWSQGTTGYLNIPGGITKTGRSRQIPLNSRVSRVLRYLESKSESKFIFPSRYIPNARQTNYSKSWESACQRIGIEADPYNLRDTYITNRLRAGISSVFIAKYIDSSALMIEKKYAVAEQKTMQGVAG